MKYDPLQARVMLVDGPVAIFLHQASERDLREAYARLGALVNVACTELGKADKEEKRDEFARTQR